MSRSLSFLSQSAAALLQGKKVDGGSEQTPQKVSVLLDLLLKMHRMHLVPQEPQSYIRTHQYRNRDKNGVFLGQTHVQPVSNALRIDAKHLRSICQQKNLPVAEYEFLGLDWSKRFPSPENPQFHTDKAAVLGLGDISSLWQVISLIQQRENGQTGAPIIIQNTNHLWGGLIEVLTKGWKKRGIDPNQLGIFISSGAVETADILAGIETVPKISPDQIQIPGSYFPEIENPTYLFATTDDKKFEEIKTALRASGATGQIRRVFDVLGKYEISPEEKYSYEGNAAEKMEALIERIRVLGVDVVRQLLKSHGIDTDQVVLMTNDGGLGFCMENSSGDRMIDLFTERNFHDSYHRMNVNQMRPAVELAYLMKTVGLETAMEQLQKDVDEFVKSSNGKFRREDLRAYDTSLQMAVPLKRVLDAIAEKKPTDLESLGVVSTFAADRLKVSFEPKGPKDGKYETVNYLLVPNTQLTRAENPEWVTDGPNAKGFRSLQALIGANNPKDRGSKAAEYQIGGMKKDAMGLILTPTHLFAHAASPALTSMRRILKADFGISARAKGNEWNIYKDDLDQVIAQACSGVSNSAYRDGLRRLLDECAVTDKKPSVLYLGHQKNNGKSVLPFLMQSLTLLSAIVRNQTFDPVNLVVLRPAVEKLMKLIAHRQALGLIGQATSQLMKVVDTEEQAAAAIAGIVRDGGRKITRQSSEFSSDGQAEGRQCMAVTTYFSATNVNKTLLDSATRLGYLMAVNGFNLKIGGGNDGLMKAAADGFQKGKKELEAKGHHFPNQLILIQCTGTESIEKAYQGGGIYRCHSTIEAREADLQNTDFVIGGAGGAGTDEEIFADFVSRKLGLIDAKKVPFVLFNQQVQTNKGMVGVHDPYKDMFKDTAEPDFYEKNNVSFALTPEEIVARAAHHRQEMRNNQQVISLDQFRKAAKERQSGAVSDRRFVPSYGAFLGQENTLSPANGSEGQCQRRVALG